MQSFILVSTAQIQLIPYKSGHFWIQHFQLDSQPEIIQILQLRTTADISISRRRMMLLIKIYDDALQFQIYGCSFSFRTVRQKSYCKCETYLLLPYKTDRFALFENGIYTVTSEPDQIFIISIIQLKNLSLINFGIRFCRSLKQIK